MALQPRTLHLPDDLWQRLLSHLRASLPNEGCGLIAVPETGSSEWRASCFYPGGNIDASPTRFTMDPADALAAFAEIDRQGWQLGAIVHSHPSTEPTPSATDLREAYYPEAIALIVSFASDPPIARGWWMGSGQPVEVALNAVAAG